MSTKSSERGLHAGGPGSVVFQDVPVDIGVLGKSEAGPALIFRTLCHIAAGESGEHHGPSKRSYCSELAQARPSANSKPTSAGSASVRIRLNGRSFSVAIDLPTGICVSFETDDRLSAVVCSQSVILCLSCVPALSRRTKKGARSYNSRCTDATLGGLVDTDGVLTSAFQYRLDLSTRAEHMSAKRRLLDISRQGSRFRPVVREVANCAETEPSGIVVTQCAASDFAHLCQVSHRTPAVLGSECDFDVAFLLENLLSLGIIHIFQLSSFASVLQALPPTVACRALRLLGSRKPRELSNGREQVASQLYACLAQLESCVQQVLSVGHSANKPAGMNRSPAAADAAAPQSNGNGTLGTELDHTTAQSTAQSQSDNASTEGRTRPGTSTAADATAEDDEMTYMMCRRVYVTPLAILCGNIQRELSNRVVRNFWQMRDRFVRVHFCDESLAALNRSAAGLERVRRVMTDGFHLCGRHYELLAFSASQLRDRSAWFFARSEGFCAADIRGWLGDFRLISNPAKYFARLGQSFSATHTTNKLARLINRFERIRDVTSPDGKYVFSDGVGRISLEFARKAANSLGVGKDQAVPSAFQIRFGGYKGVVSVYPKMPAGVCLQLRASMDKFHCRHDQLEVIRSAERMPGFLNRQLILLLSTMGVPDSVFIHLQDKVIRTLNHARLKKECALRTIRFHGCHLPSTPLHCLQEMLDSGVSLAAEPFMQRCLSALAQMTMRSLRYRSRIAVESSGFFMGIMDEEDVLEYGQVFIAVRGHEDKPSIEVITGPVVVGKNPCYHPGDLRVLQAIDHPSLRHLVDCIVFPQRGPRPHPDECSGSDLDGDLYFAAWDEHLIPPRVFEAMDYTPPTPIAHATGNTVADMAEHFVEFLKSDMLGVISNAHLALADNLENGALSAECLELAYLNSLAVDYPKTGVPAVMGPHLRVQQFPDFMQKADGFRRAVYPSNKVLGRLYRAACTSQTVLEAEERASPGAQAAGRSSADCEQGGLHYHCDDDLLIDGYASHLTEARRVFQEYRCRLLVFMDQYGVSSEADLFAGVCAGEKSHGRGSAGQLSNSKQYDMRRHQLAELSAYLDQVYNNVFLDQSAAEHPGGHLGDPDSWRSHEQYYLEKASAWYKVGLEYNLSQYSPSSKAMCHSFPWLAHRQLCALKRRKLMQSKLFGRS
ncbi:uncharacterized protein LOC135814727 [Sycon ciliatum]|uniref:uncharacterized protein LOC135814727 n=1 Tax=Sycon ciliatum TaxID=27933 RepID=UPI0031F70014